jgi:hypothetical protein
LAPTLRLKTPATILAIALVAYIVCDILLTPPAHLETRPVAQVTGIGIAGLGLLFLGLALAIVSLVLIYRRSQRAPIVAIVAAVLFYPAGLAEQTGHFSSLKPPTAIEAIELVQFAVALIVIGAGLWTYRSGIGASTS